MARVRSFVTVRLPLGSGEVADEDLAFAARLGEALAPDGGDAFASVYYLRQRLQRVARTAPPKDDGFASFLDDHPELLGDEA